MCSLSFHWSASSSYLLLIYGRFCRFNDTTPHRMGTSGIIHLGFIGWEHRASFIMKFSSYELVPTDVQDKLMKDFEAKQTEE